MVFGLLYTVIIIKSFSDVGEVIAARNSSCEISSFKGVDLMCGSMNMIIPPLSILATLSSLYWI